MVYDESLCVLRDPIPRMLYSLRIMRSYPPSGHISKRVYRDSEDVHSYSEDESTPNAHTNSEDVHSYSEDGSTPNAHTSSDSEDGFPSRAENVDSLSESIPHEEGRRTRGVSLHSNSALGESIPHEEGRRTRGVFPVKRPADGTTQVFIPAR